MPLKLTLKGARELAGAVSISNSKMPGGSFALATSGCNVGGRLAKVEGSVCHKCYAVRIEKLRPAVLAAWTRNLDRVRECMATAEGRKAWTDAMIVQVQWAVDRTGERYFRWFDSGDLPASVTGLHMLDCIAAVALALPDVDFWLPTREVMVVNTWRMAWVVPHNLTIRLSSAMIGATPLRVSGEIKTSTVHRAHRKTGADPVGHICPARLQGNQCGACRACWSRDIANVSYPAH
jgi:hypothetical protein